MLWCGSEYGGCSFRDGVCFWRNIGVWSSPQSEWESSFMHDDEYAL